MFGSLDISTSGLVAQRIRLDTIAGNIANADATTRSDGKSGPFQRRLTMFAAGDGRGGAGVHVKAIREDASPPRLVYEPEHPDAIQSGPNQGMVQYPNVDLGTEMINGMLASRAYEANISAMEVTKHMMSATMRLLV